MKESNNPLDNKEGEKLPDISNLENSVKNLEDKLSQIDESKLNENQKRIFEAIKVKIKRVVTKLAKTVVYTAVSGSILIAMNDKRTDTDLEIIKNGDQTERYIHPDEQTTHLLNILGGKEKFDEKDVRTDWDNLFEYLFKNKLNIPLDKKIAEMSIEEVDSLIYANKEVMPADTQDSIKEHMYRHIIEEELKNLNRVDTTEEYTLNPKAYDLVWQLEQEAGNPRIRFNSETMGVSDVLRTLHTIGRYDPINHIIYVDPLDLSRSNHTPADRTFISEMSHAKQYKDRSIGTTLQFISDIIGVIKRSKFNLDKFSTEYKKLYETPGSVEHEAHEVIEKYLKDKYPIFIKGK